MIIAERPALEGMAGALAAACLGRPGARLGVPVVVSKNWQKMRSPCSEVTLSKERSARRDACDPGSR